MRIVNMKEICCEIYDKKKRETMPFYVWKVQDTNAYDEAENLNANRKRIDTKLDEEGTWNQSDCFMQIKVRHS
jgi:hypothetical protein